MTEIRRIDWPFVVQKNREEVTGEHDHDGFRKPRRGQDIDWIGYKNQGGGHVPDDYESASVPKELQEETSHG